MGDKNKALNLVGALKETTSQLVRGAPRVIEGGGMQVHSPVKISSARKSKEKLTVVRLNLNSSGSPLAGSLSAHWPSSPSCYLGLWFLLKFYKNNNRRQERKILVGVRNERKRNRCERPHIWCDETIMTHRRKLWSHLHIATFKRATRYVYGDASSYFTGFS